MPKRFGKTATIHDVARLAGVSPATASLALNGRPGVASETRLDVLGAAEKLRYVPNVNGRRLANRRADALGVIQGCNMSTLFSDSFYRMVLYGVGEVAQTNGYSLMIAPTIRQGVSQHDFLRAIGRGAVDGVLIVGVPDQPWIPALQEYGLAVVLIDTYLPGSNVPAVVHDYQGGIFTATEHLLNLGHRRIGFVGAAVNYPFGWETHEGYREALSRHGIAYEAALVRRVEIDVEAAAAAAHALRSLPSPPTAVVAVTDAMAIGVLRASRELGLRVPQDLAVVGMDDIELSAHTDPPLTTVRVPKEEMGRVAAQRLIALSRDESIRPEVVVLDGALVIRESCGARHRGA